MRIQIRVIWIAIAVLSVYSVAGPAAGTSPPITECDRLTAHAGDPDRVASDVAFEEINAAKAVAACRAALEGSESPRLLFQLGRALDASGKAAEANTYYERAAAKDYAAAHFSLFLILTEPPAKSEPKTAFGHLERAAELGHTGAQLRLSAALMNGDFGAKDLNRAAALLKPLAERDDTEAQKALGAVILREGSKFGDISDARRWLERAAEKDDLNTLLLLAHHYRQGQPFGRDPRKSKTYAKRAAALAEPLAKAGDPEAQLLLGQMYLGGLGVDKNPALALDWLHRSAEQGLDIAQFQLGRALLLGVLGQFNDTEAFRWLETSAAAGYGPARELLAKQYGSCLMSKELTSFLCESQERALAWIRKHAEAGDPHAAFVLGLAYDRGLKVPQDSEMARKWFGISRRNGLN